MAADADRDPENRKSAGHALDQTSSATRSVAKTPDSTFRLEVFGQARLALERVHLPSLHDGQIDETGVGGGMIDLLLGLLIVGWLGEEDVGHIGLRVTIVEWKPARLHLHQNAMTGKKDVVRVGQVEAIRLRRVGRNGLRLFKALAIASAKNVRRDH